MSDFGSFDDVIIGGGSTGCLLAHRLSQNPQTRALMLEVGGRDNYFKINRCWPFAASRDSAFQVRVPPNNGLQGDAPRAARA